jgi:hypothetical protein
MTKILLVKDDTRPNPVVDLTVKETGLPFDISAASLIELKIRASGGSAIIATLTGTALIGLYDPDTGVLDTASPYNVAGKGGRVSFSMSSAATATAGNYEGEIEITFSDATIQTVYDLVKLTVREDF